VLELLYRGQFDPADMLMRDPNLTLIKAI